MIPSDLQRNIDQLQVCLSSAFSGSTASDSEMKSVTAQVGLLKSAIEDASPDVQLNARKVLNTIEKGWGTPWKITNLFLSKQRKDELKSLRAELSACSQQLKAKVMPAGDELRNVDAIYRALMPKAANGDTKASKLMKDYVKSLPNHTPWNWDKLNSALKTHEPIATELILMEGALFRSQHDGSHGMKLREAVDQVDNVMLELNLNSVQKRLWMMLGK